MDPSIAQVYYVESGPPDFIVAVGRHLEDAMLAAEERTGISVKVQKQMLARELEHEEFHIEYLAPDAPGHVVFSAANALTAVGFLLQDFEHYFEP
jgi:hypothetical protein